MWSLYQSSQAFHTRPATLIGMDQDPYTAYCIDEAVLSWGSFITGELDKVEGKNSKDTARKRKNKLLKLLQAPDEQRFRSLRRSKPEGTVKRS